MCNMLIKVVLLKRHIPNGLPNLTPTNTTNIAVYVLVTPSTSFLTMSLFEVVNDKHKQTHQDLYSRYPHCRVSFINRVNNLYLKSCAPMQDALC